VCTEIRVWNPDSACAEARFVIGWGI
jgi:hypothetical protein